MSLKYYEELFISTVNTYNREISKYFTKRGKYFMKK